MPDSPESGPEPLRPVGGPSRLRARFPGALVLAATAVIAGFCLAAHFGWTAGRGGEVRREFEVMRTSARILIPAGAGGTVSPEAAADAAEAALRRVNDLMGPIGELSDIRRLNQSPAGEWVEVNPLTWKVVMEALRWHRLSGGAFDPTIGPVKTLFRFDQGELDAWPDADALAAARKGVGADKLLYDREGMRLSWAIDGMRLDLGAIAKGFGADQAAETLVGLGVRHAMVEVGGELRFFGGKPDASPNPWRIGVRDPRLAAGSEAGGAGLRDVLELTDGGVASSGDYENYFTHHGEKYQHIIDPRRALPIRIGPGTVAGVTVIHPDSCVFADAFATTLSVLGPEDARSFLESQALGLFSRGVRVIMFVHGERDGELRKIAFSVDNRGVLTVEEDT